MKKGVVIYAHNNRTVDYAMLALISGGLAKKHLKVPVSLITDETTYQWMIDSKIDKRAQDIFENIIFVPKPETYNKRRLCDGANSDMVPFVNENRYSVWSITPYDRTLLIDSDFLIWSDNLEKFWDVDEDILLGESINDIYGSQRVGYLDRYISETGIKMYWATTVMFTKNEKSKLFFDTVECIKNNYKWFADVFRFDNRQYRNDISFSIAKHIMDGFEQNTSCLPSLLTVLDRDILYTIDGKKLTFLIDHRLDNNFCAATISDMDIHIMNKQSIFRNKDILLESI
jgi:hypothetical protein